ncbi:hypothetical protein GW17_00018545 [Ensete ventricosum]|nr:hypothetical protein GW17_00018548 [Ensete ventricosum]RWW17519.1 hypothetical protein GW17_00018545 [Ensete ventricosum]
MASASGPPAMALQSSEMLSRDQLLDLFARFDSLTSQPDVKRRIADAVKDKQVLICRRHSPPSLLIFRPIFSILYHFEAVAVTTAIQEEILLEMGIG